MCLIIHNPNYVDIDPHLLFDAVHSNRDGFGIIDHVTKQTIRILEYEPDQMVEFISSYPNPYTLHLRYKTVGAVNKSNVHPFKIKGTPSLLMTNGTIPNLGNQNMSDSRHLAKMLSLTPQELWREWLSVFQARCLVYTPDKEALLTGKWHFHEGAWFSKDDYFYSDDRDLQPSVDHECVAVYGTLREGMHNNYLLESSEHLGEGETVDSYTMHVDGIPYLHVDSSHPDADSIVVDVYEVDQDTLKRLDQLEGHPSWYERQLVDIELIHGQMVKAWVYFQPGPAPQTGNFTRDYCEFELNQPF